MAHASLLLEPVALNGELELHLPSSEEQILCTEEAMEQLQVGGPSLLMHQCPSWVWRSRSRALPMPGF